MIWLFVRGVCWLLWLISGILLRIVRWFGKRFGMLMSVILIRFGVFRLLFCLVFRGRGLIGWLKVFLLFMRFGMFVC